LVNTGILCLRVCGGVCVWVCEGAWFAKLWPHQINNFTNWNR